MRTVTTTKNLYSFDELSEEAQKKAIEKFRETELDYEWYDGVFDDFKEICKHIGMEVDLKRVFFNGFYTQGSGSFFTASVEMSKLLEGIKKQAWKEHAPLQDFDFPEISIDRRVLKLIEEGIVYFNTSNIKASNHETSVTAYLEYGYDYGQCENYNNIEKHLDTLEEFLQDVADELNNFLYRQLEKEYEYLTSDEAIKETIECNDYEFTEDGELA